MRLFFLGTNGWFTTRTGSTVCAAISLGDRLLVLDAGEGFCRLPALMEKLGVKKADVFLSHLHIDHVCGLHTLPLMPKGREIRIFAHKSCLPHLRRLMAHPYTATPREEPAKVTLLPLSTGWNRIPCKARARAQGRPSHVSRYDVRALPLIHADPCFGYRIEAKGRAVSYCTDTGPCENMGRLSAGAGILISECALLPGAGEEKAWPHLSPEMAAKIAKAAGVGRLLLTHFDAKRYDSPSLRRKAEKAARRIFPRSTAAHDGLSLRF